MSALRFVRPAMLLAALLLVGGCGWRSSFPTEDEVRGKLQRGMTADEVFAVFGKPDGHQFIKFELGGKLHWVAPPATRTVPREGYAGFTVYFVKDKVWDWEVIQLKPSYEPRLLGSRLNRWGLVGVIVLFVGVGVAFAGRAAWRRREEKNA